MCCYVAAAIDGARPRRGPIDSTALEVDVHFLGVNAGVAFGDDVA